MNLDYPNLDTPFLADQSRFPDEVLKSKRPPSKKRATAPPPVPLKRAELRYRRGVATGRIPWVGMIVAAGVLAGGLLCFNGRPTPKPKVAEAEETLTLIDISKLKPISDDEPEPTGDATPEQEGIDAPALPDLPGVVTVENAFVQQIDFSTLRPQATVSASNLIAIPAMIRHSGAESALRGLKDIFNLSDLDRVPEPLFQPVPRVGSKLMDDKTQVHVTVEFIVTKTGDVLDPRIIHADNRAVGEIAAAAVAKWKFRAGIKAGQRVNTRVRQPIVFNLAEDE